MDNILARKIQVDTTQTHVNQQAQHPCKAGKTQKHLGKKSWFAQKKSWFHQIVPQVRGPRFEVRGSMSEVRGSRSEVRGSRFEVRGPRFEVRGPRQSFSAFAIRQSKVPLTLQGCHELLTMIHFITDNNNELLTMILLSKHISLLNQQSVCNSPHHILNIFTVNRTVMHDDVD